MDHPDLIPARPHEPHVQLPAVLQRHRVSREGVVPEPHKISIRHLDFFYGETQALTDVSLEIADHTVTALIGPSGCGKSTLLRTLNRLYTLYPDQRATGEIVINDANILDPATDLRLLRANVGMMFQISTPFPMSISANISFGIDAHFRIGRAERELRVEKALRGAALWEEVKDRLHKSALSLSGGQQQRLCIARAIAMEPEILLLDEPCSALDPVSTSRIEDLIDQLARHYCIVIVTHNLQQAARVADITAFMYLGKLIEVGPTEEMFLRPKDRQTIDYITGRFG